MADLTKRPVPDQSDPDRNHLLNRIDELEALLAKKKAETQQTPKLNVGTDGIPVLVETVVDDSTNSGNTPTLDGTASDNEIINDIINKVDKEISQDLDELIVMLKDSIIDEVKTRLLEELHIREDKTSKEQNTE